MPSCSVCATAALVGYRDQIRNQEQRTQLSATIQLIPEIVAMFQNLKQKLLHASTAK